MPAVSDKQRKLMAIAEHHPEKLYKKNKAVAKMTKSQLHDYASTKSSELVDKASSKIQAARKKK
jgi:hypothetical protein